MDIQAQLLETLEEISAEITARVGEKADAIVMELGELTVSIPVLELIDMRRCSSPV